MTDREEILRQTSPETIAAIRARQLAERRGQPIDAVVAPAPAVLSPNYAGRMVDGASFVFAASDSVPALWGSGDDVLWAAGESLFLVGPSGTGKTTIVQQLVLARLGVGPGSLLGFDVPRTDRRVLYVAADRPVQAARSMRRMVSEGDVDLLKTGLEVWKGPLPFDLGRHPEILRDLAVDADAGTVVVDSLKDVAVDLSKDETGSRVNSALQLTVAAGVEVVVCHHQRKPQQGAAKPKALADVYGSTWITAGAGSVVLLWGDPGDPVVELSHLKQPAGTVGPVSLLHDHRMGRTTAIERPDAFTLVCASSRGMTARQVAAALKGAEPAHNDIERARRKLNDLANRGQISRQPGSTGGVHGGEATLYFPIARDSERGARA